MNRTPMKRSRPKPAVPPDVRDALAKRSGGWCEMRLEGCWGTATDPCHRLASGAGGRHGDAKTRHDRLSNLIHGCRSCHGWTHSRVAEAEDMGLMLREGDVAEEIPAMLRHALVPVFLDNDGGWEAMVDSRPDAVVAFMRGNSRGTAHTVRLAEEAEITTQVVPYPGESA